ncbi:PEP-CTERM sorting domain-containing protein [Aestuariispira insulae]|uniref:Putative secreted protein n=1 Tax=Aestuariispira insulae TaxID=1461337 RepID=A0A3D9HK99_9PROT|nr:PEP-CTERM sorting domain-containing protein [Aestuariispira insulae]RED49920.1 putative secreted protein [Aestuariispira insulae]
MSRTKFLLAFLSFVFVILGGQAQAALIDFDPLNNAHGSSYTGHAQDGHTVTATGGNWSEGHNVGYGKPVPAIFGSFRNNQGGGEVVVTGGLFRFISVEVMSLFTSGARLDVTGKLGGVTQYGYSFNIPTTNVFEKLVHPFQFDVLIDELYLAWSPGDNQAGLAMDNILLRSEEVPAPAALGLMLMGLAGLVALRRRKS